MQMEIMINIGDSPDPTGYMDGDVIQCYPFQETLLAKAQYICRPKHFGYNSSGLRDLDTLLEKYEKRVNKYKFERVSSTEALRTNLITQEQTLLSPIPNAQGESILVQALLDRMLNRSNHRVFGNNNGEEIWYFDSIHIFDNTEKIDEIWGIIETETGILKSENLKKDFTPTEMQTKLILDCTGYLEETYREISKPTAIKRESSITTRVDENDDTAQTNLVAKRKWKIPYKDLSSSLEINIDDVLNLEKAVDPRKNIPAEQKNKLDEIMFDKISTGEVVL